MGVFDNIKGRLGFGTANVESDWQEEDYPVQYDDGYGDGGAYDNGNSGIYRNGRVIGYGAGYGDGRSNGRGNGRGNGYGNGGGYDDYDHRPASMRTFGVDRADYYTDNHTPLVSQHDVRAQTIVATVPVGYVQDRIPAPQPYKRGTPKPTVALREEDPSVYKNGLARTPGSFSQLHSTRLRMEDSEKVVSFNADPARNVAGALPGHQSAISDIYQGVGSGQVRQRSYRSVEHVRPITYADAEQIAVELKKGSVVVLDLRTTRPDLAKRILDFSFGVASALDGQVERYADRVYLFTTNGAVLDAERAAIRV